MLGGSLLSPVTHQSCPVSFPPLAKRPVHTGHFGSEDLETLPQDLGILTEL